MKEKLLYSKIVNGRLAFNSRISFYKGPIRLKIYKDRVVASGLFIRKTIPISKIIGLRQLSWGPIGYAMFQNTQRGIIRYIAFRITGKNDSNLREVYNALKKAGAKIE
jgi:hypothetical protein